MFLNFTCLNLDVIVVNVLYLSIKVKYCNIMTIKDGFNYGKQF